MKREEKISEMKKRKIAAMKSRFNKGGYNLRNMPYGNMLHID